MRRCISKLFGLGMILAFLVYGVGSSKQPEATQAIVDESTPQTGTVFSIGEGGSDFYGQSFIADISPITRFGVWLQEGSPEGQVRLAIAPDDGSGNPDEDAVLYEGALVDPSPNGRWFYEDAIVNVNIGMKYWVLIDGYDNPGASGWSYAGTSSSYTDTGENFKYSNDGGSSWRAWSSPLAIYVEGGGAPISVPLVEDFETGDFSKHPWSASYWRVTSEEAHSGSYSAAAYSRSTGVLEVTLNTGAGQISFWRYSDDNGWLEFYIDGVLTGDWDSMPSTWIRESFTVSAGTHTFRWEASSSDYDDNDVYIDDITFPGLGGPGQIIFQDDFETCDFSQLPWRTNAGIDTSECRGKCAAELGPGEYLELTFTVPDGTISFFINLVESDNRLRFSIDGEARGEWTYTREWEQVSFNVSAGAHTFRWENTGGCCVEIDDIVYTGTGIGGPAVILVWVSRFASGDPDNRVINFVQLVPQAGKCGILDNVDLVNRTGSYANDFEIIVEGTYNLVQHYTDPRYPAGFEQVPGDGLTLFRWRFDREVPPGGFAHLGLWVWATDCNIRIKAMSWTRYGSVIGKVPASGLRVAPSRQVEIVNNSDETLEIEEPEVAQVFQPLPLEALNAEEIIGQLRNKGRSSSRLWAFPALLSSIQDKLFRCLGYLWGGAHRSLMTTSLWPLLFLYPSSPAARSTLMARTTSSAST